MRALPELKITLTYLIVAGLWIYLSDRVLGALVSSGAEMTRWAQLKGLMFVAVTGGLLYGMLHRTFERMRHSQQRLAEQEEYFRTLADNISQLAWMADETGSVFWYNRRWYSYTGATFEDTGGWGWRKVIHPDHLERVVERIRECLRKVQVWEDTFPMRGRDGEYRWFLSRAVPIRDSHGRVVRWLGTGTDITDLREIQDQLASLVETCRRANNDLEQFVHVASHDLQEPMRVIAGYLQLLEKEAGGRLDSQSTGYIHAATDSAQRMHQLIRDLLEYARIRVSSRGMQSVDLEKTLADVLQAQQKAIQDSHASITHDPLPAVVGDGECLARLLTHLIGNALKFHEPGQPPRIHVGAERQPGVWRFRLRDEGIGITPKYHERIFQVFQRLHDYSRYPGSGIGLSICQRIIELHGGEIGVESQEGQGATFYFTIPDRRT